VPLPSSLGTLVHAQILKSDIEPDDVLYTALVDSYIKNGKVGYARTVLAMMLEKNVICSTSMISGYMNQGSVDDAEDIFRKAVEKDVVVYNVMIEGYSKSIKYARRSLEVHVDMQDQTFGLVSLHLLV
jgi:pentatricopeptide repeat protein